MDYKLLLAAEQGNLEDVKHLASKCGNNYAVIAACKHGHLDVVKFLVQKHDHHCFVTSAAENGHLEIVKYLESQGGDIQREYTFNLTCENGHLEVVKYLVSKGYRINNSAIIVACKKGHLEIIKFLIEAHDFIDLGSAVNYASTNGHLEVVKYLVTQGADIQSNDNVIITTLQNGHLKVLKYLMSQGIDIKNPKYRPFMWIFWAESLGHFEMVKYLVSLGVPIVYVENERCKAYLSFCERMEEKKPIRAQKKIYFWWIQICYNPETNVGKRMLEKSWTEFDKIQKKN